MREGPRGLGQPPASPVRRRPGAVPSSSGGRTATRTDDPRPAGIISDGPRPRLQAGGAARASHPWPLVVGRAPRRPAPIPLWADEEGVESPRGRRLDARSPRLVAAEEVVAGSSREGRLASAARRPQPVPTSARPAAAMASRGNQRFAAAGAAGAATSIASSSSGGAGL